MLVGGAAGSLVDHPALALGLGVVSHLPLDMVPHHDLRGYRRDVAITTAVAAVTVAAAALRGVARPGLWWGMAGGILPDIENLLWHLGWIEGRYRVFPTHREGRIRHGAVRGPSNLVVQALVGLGAFIFVLR